ncbi:hypothetical protein [Paenibacillus durus]|uniref:Uncharacterized protein n=1 Tax=Paenibacillus durus ATCC 35681 TaxID=1333534 RepID=A0A0F7FBJ1_PAEDU|nr:hypothetical protein [Paenibacillus durus]AKG36077.1 hypothetical protein VK70_17190 [Paenibacillus durus ATCC 35681]
MAYNGKTNWTDGEIVYPEDMNRIEQGITDARGALDTHIADYVRQPAYAATSGTSAAYTVTLSPAPISIGEGFGITIVPHVDNGANPTLQVNSLNPAALKDKKGNGLTAGKLKVGYPYTFVYVSSAFILMGEGGGEIPKLPNMLKGGSFENTGANIVSNSAYSTTYRKFGSYSLSVTCPLGSLENVVSIPTNITTIANHQYYLSVWAYSTTSGASAQMYARGAEPSVSALLTANTWNFMSGILTFSTTTTDSARLDNNTAYSTIYYDGFMIIDLTDAFGVGKEPSKSEMDDMVQSFGGWWDTDLANLTSDANAAASEVLSGKTYYSNGLKNTGAMARRTGGEFPGYERAQTVASNNGRVHLYAPLGAYVDQTGDQGGNHFGVFADDPDFNSINFPDDKNVYGLQGSMPRRGGYTNPISTAWDGSTMWVRIPQGAYQTNGGAGYPEITLSAAQARADGNIQPGNIRDKVWIYGTQGTLVADSSGRMAILYDLYPGAWATGTWNIATIPQCKNFIFGAHSGSTYPSRLYSYATDGTVSQHLYLYDNQGVSVTLLTLNWGTTLGIGSIIFNAAARMVEIYNSGINGNDSYFGTRNLPGNFNVNGPLTLVWDCQQPGSASPYPGMRLDGMVLYA